MMQDPAEAAVYALALSPDFAADSTCFAATARGLLKSTDAGATFGPAYESLNLLELLPTSAAALSPAFARDHTVFAGVAGGVLRSRDAGTSWQVAALRTPPPVVTGLAVSPAYEEDGVLFAGTLEDGVFRSGDRGSSWAFWNFGLIDLGVMCLAVSPAFGRDETLLAGTETGLFRSSNGGRAWRETSFPTEMAPVLALALSPDYARDGTIWAGTEEHGLWRSGDRGKTWGEVPALSGQTVNGLAVTASGRVACLGDAGIVVWDGAHWQAAEEVVDGDGTGAMCIAAAATGEGEWLLAGTPGGQIVRIKL